MSAIILGNTDITYLYRYIIICGRVYTTKY